MSLNHDNFAFTNFDRSVSQTTQIGCVFLGQNCLGEIQKTFNFVSCVSCTLFVHLLCVMHTVH